jgi:hypothetical protein
MNPDAGIMSWEQADQIMQDQRAEIERLREAIRRLADQDATLSVCDGNVTVTMDSTLTDEEREAIEVAAMIYEQGATQMGHVEDGKRAVALRAMLERIG